MTTALSHEPSRVDAPISDFDPYAEDALDNPYPHYEVLRELGPIVHLQRYGVYAIARHAEIDAVLRDHVTFCSSAGVGLANFHTEEPWRKPSLILEADPPMHGRTRKVVAGLLAPASINKLRPTFERQAELLIDRILEKGRFDAVPDLCAAYPLKVFGDAVGVPAGGRQHLLPYGDMVFNGFGPINERFKTRLAAAQESIAWIGEVCKRENLTPDGFGAQLYRAADDGDLAPEEAPMLGRNGMGKSTLLKSLVGVVAPRDGEVSIDNRSTRGMSVHQIAQLGIAYVPEGRGIFPNLSVRENLNVSARPGVDGRRDWTFERVLEVFPRLAERLGHGGQQLSGGEQQMLTIGRALMTNPLLLILDEATEGLAPLIAQEIWRIIGLIRAAGIATVLVDKNWKAVAGLTDRNLILVKGRVVLEGTGEQMRSQPDRLAEYLGV